jgi:hypothetical protein
MKFLVLSHTHSLLPFAYRLQLSGADVQPVVVVQAFEAAWRGKIDKSPRDQKGRLDQTWVGEQANKTDIVLTDDWKLQSFLSHVSTFKKTYGVHQQHHTTDGGLEGPLRLGAWFDGENLHGHHLLVIDRGAWPGGMGPSIDGGLTMVRIDIPETMWMMDQLANQQVDELKTSGFRGLVQFNLNFQTPSGEPEVDGMLAGWPFLHTHAFVSELEDLAGLLEKGVDTQSSNHPSQTLLPRKFVSVLPVSRPPWPTRKARFRFDLAEVGGLTQEQMARVFWHDVQVDQEGGKLTTAGLDGLVGVVRGAADTNELALVRALEVALRLQLPEKQFRSDAGRRVQSVLAELEGRFGVLL